MRHDLRQAPLHDCVYFHRGDHYDNGGNAGVCLPSEFADSSSQCQVFISITFDIHHLIPLGTPVLIDAKKAS